MEHKKCSKPPISTCLLVDTHPFPFWLPLLKCVQNHISSTQMAQRGQEAAAQPYFGRLNPSVDLKRL
jgi:hypothetical protein